MIDRGGKRRRSEPLQGGGTRESQAVDRAMIAVYLSVKLDLTAGDALGL
jgi:hypothetical protein